MAYFLNQKTIEPWYNTGNEYPFDLNTSAFSDRGCYTPWSYCETDETIYWLGDDKTVYAMNNFSPKAISGHAEEYELKKADCSGAYMTTYSSEGHDFVFLHLPGSNKTMCYDAATGLWHDRQTGSTRHFANDMITVDGVTYAGAHGSASVYIMDSDIGSDDGAAMYREMITPPDLFVGRINSAELVMQHYNPPAPGKLWVDMTPAERKIMKQWPEIVMEYTDDDGKSWSNPDAISLEPYAEMRAVWNKLQYSRRRSYKFSMKADMPCAWVSVWLT
jgi:hypothetical protein